MINFKHLYIIALTLITPCFIIAQSRIVSDLRKVGGTVEFKVDSALEAKDEYIGRPQQILKTTFTRKRSKTIAAEIIYLSYERFSYTEYDLIGQIRQQGIFRQDTTTMRDIMFTIPNWRDDPDGSKGLLKDYMIGNGLIDVVKEGYWLETITAKSKTTLLSGFYKDGLKEGLWEQSKTFPQGQKLLDLPPDSLINYNAGKRTMVRRAPAKQTDTVTLLRGSWFWAGDGNNEFEFSNIPGGPYDNEAFNFFSPNFFHSRFYNSPLPFETGEWRIENGTLWVNDEKTKIGFTIVELNKTTLRIKTK